MYLIRVFLLFWIAASVGACVSIAKDSRELHAVGLREGIGESAEARVIIDRPGKHVVLLLGSQTAIRWKVDSTSRTRFERIVLYGNGRRSSQVFLNGRPYEDFESNEALPLPQVERGLEFRAFVESVPPLYGFAQLDSFHGSEWPPHYGIHLSERQYYVPQLRPNYLAEYVTHDQLPDLTFVANLNGVLGRYDLQGVLLERVAGHKITSVSVQDSGVAFTFNERGLEKSLGIGREVVQIDVPCNIPAPTGNHAVIGAAYDTKRGLVLGVTFTGGYLYTYDPATGEWILRRMTEDRLNFLSLGYDEAGDRYIMTVMDSSRRSAVLKYSPNTRLLIKRGPLLALDPLNPYPGLADLERGSEPALKIHAINEGKMVLTAQDEPTYRYRIYLYDLFRDTVSLVHFQDNFDPSGARSD